MRKLIAISAVVAALPATAATAQEIRRRADRARTPVERRPLARARGVPAAARRAGRNDRGQVVGSWVGPDAAVDPATAETHGFLWHNGRYKTFDVPGATATTGYEIKKTT